MRALLVLVVLHVSNAFVVISSANEMNTSMQLNEQKKHFNQYINMNVLAISHNMLLNHLWKLETLTHEQCLQLCNNMASASSLQIFNNESMQSINKIIRIFQSVLSANTKQSKKNLCSKTSTTSVFISTSTIQLTTYKLTFTAVAFRYITVTKD
ncbi:hypothetical protein RFI_04349 [Reticulomyxa filosa]|uniref:Uncharacterized protein n=1 Tax=Reticulomyxa filosa TaxID=46433 RepID=X6P599_RETFI|nr:hypothetical protein RFI_04349 [Reticulomyxa filosa]|eukprot:ETO32767.1 hypothetical protein RFI_04349 [Reticulomyxa filosa]